MRPINPFESLKSSEGGGPPFAPAKRPTEGLSWLALHAACVLLLWVGVAYRLPSRLIPSNGSWIRNFITTWGEPISRLGSVTAVPAAIVMTFRTVRCWFSGRWVFGFFHSLTLILQFSLVPFLNADHPHPLSPALDRTVRGLKETKIGAPPARHSVPEWQQELSRQLNDKQM
jgi:hypothetical protein